MAGKKYREFQKKVDSEKQYSLEEAVALAKSTSPSKFDASVDIAVRLGVDPKQADQNIRGMIKLPHGGGKEVRVVVFAKPDKAAEATKAGAVDAGDDELVKKISEGWLEFDAAVATPDMMGKVGRIGKILGPRGLMPNPKLGTVTMDVAGAVSELRSGKREYKVDKAGIVHFSVGRVSMSVEQLHDNVMALIDLLNKVKPASAKGIYVKTVSLTTTMGPGIRLNPAFARGVAEAA